MLGHEPGPQQRGLAAPGRTADRRASATDCSRATSSSTSTSRPKKNAASSGWNDARPLYGHVVAGCRGAESDPDRPGGLVERRERGRLPLGHRRRSAPLAPVRGRERTPPATPAALWRAAHRGRRSPPGLAGEEVPQHGGRRVDVGRRADLRTSTCLLRGAGSAACRRRSSGPAAVRSWSLASPRSPTTTSLARGEKAASLRGRRTRRRLPWHRR